MRLQLNSVGGRCVRLVLIGVLAVLSSLALLRAGLAFSDDELLGVGRRLPEFRLPDPEGKTHSSAELKGARASVIVFLSPECPISNGYAPELKTIAASYTPRGVRFMGVYADPAVSASAAGRHARSFELGFPVLLDHRQALAKSLKARVTPEVFVLDSDLRLRYRGRIDDSYASRAKKNAQVRSRDLTVALDAVLAGQPIRTPITQAIGCRIPVATAAVAKQGGPTFHRDILPIFQTRCQSCHRPGQVAPFSLLTYQDARNWAAEIKEFTAGRQMPPWLAAPEYGDFQDVRRLSEPELTKIAAWVDAGAPEGNPKDAPTARVWSDEWFLGKPDVVLTMPESFEVPATGDDVFQVFVLKPELLEDKKVVAIDFKPGNSRVVHHVVSFIDPSGQGRKLDEADPAPGYNSGPGGVKVLAATIQGVWAPGNLPRYLPAGVGRTLRKGSDILIQVHYHKTGKVERDQTKLALYFAKEPVQREARTAIIGPFNIDIPPDAPRHQVTTTLKMPVSVQVLNIMPHMHLLGKEMRVRVIRPDGSEMPLVWIKDWDYRWQDSYRFKEPLLIPGGSTFELTAYFDNTSANPRNPSNPPRRVRFGEQTTDEMAFAIMEIVNSPTPVSAPPPR